MDFSEDQRMIQRTPEFNKAERAAFWPCLVPFLILCGVVPGIFEFLGYKDLPGVMQIIGLSICCFVTNPLIFKARIKEFPSGYWRYYYAIYGSLFGVVILFGGAVYWASNR